MIRIVQRSIWNLFQGTDKNWTALGAENQQKQPIFIQNLKASKSPNSSDSSKQSPSTVTPNTAFMTQIDSRPLNGYEKVAHLLPKSTDTFNKVLVMQARYELCITKKFYEKLKKVKKKIKEGKYDLNAKRNSSYAEENQQNNIVGAAQ